MARENKTQYVILGLLKDASLTGYEIREIIKEPTMYFWHETDASIYPTLKLLAKQELVKSKTIFVGKRKKEVFTITEKGKIEFERWYSTPVEIDRRRSEFLLKLFFTTPKTKKEIKRHFESRLRSYQDLLEAFKRDEHKILKDQPDKTYWIKIIENGVAHFELEIAWLKQQIKSL